MPRANFCGKLLGEKELPRLVNKNKMSKAKKIKDLEALLYNLELELTKTKQVLGELTGRTSSDAANYSLKAAQVGKQIDGDEGLVVEGVFNGQIMIGPDGKQYSVPANYASKSKLVEGDILKLTISLDGSFIFKQIAPVERARLVGHLIKDRNTNEFVVLAGDKIYKLLMASVTYFKGEEGDEVVILVPKGSESGWAAVENIIKINNHKKISTDELDFSL
ncbi:MAG: hypothetical protein A2543_01430 [Candidatus Komeilibacteria bacterium RIFOXYD2_FULL_37_8]|nr:MAG: hypothetical protein A2543_01430 [Candidatus Komeilibacteria bacterium RIFOXYD2_FULL_37_8]